ncbi:MAG: ATP-binding protein [Clostridia bacterium]
MRHKIAVKLTIYFVIALLVFALIISAVFLLLFRGNAIEMQKTELAQRGVKISETFSTYLTSDNTIGQGQGQGGGMGSMGGYGAYIRFLNDIALADVWVVDANLNIITKGQGTHATYVFSELPANAESIVKEVFTGKTAFSEDFSSVLDTPTLTFGTPLKAADGTIVGVVLLHAPVNGTDLAVSRGVLILIVSTLIALIIGVILSLLFSFSFVKPLKKMNRTARRLADGDYFATTDVLQKDEIGALAKNLDLLAVRLALSSKEREQLDQLRRDFIANISHELRTPITVMRGSLEALCDGVVTDPEKVSEFHHQMLEESKGLQRLVGDLLDLSRLQNMDFHMEKTKVSLCDVVHDAMRSAKNLADAKDVELTLENHAKNCAVEGDYGRLRQMFVTILDNAIKFSPVAGHITIRLDESGGKTVSIRDEGPGISEEDLPHIFERFYKTKDVENTSGTGLGLAIAKQIALRHDADISVESVPGNGCNFIIKFMEVTENES